jgi:poly-gamma-glutamate synthesis protein (capsule biosynthesis protein)
MQGCAGRANVDTCAMKQGGPAVDRSPYFIAVGDVAPDRAAADDCFDLSREELSKAAFVFGQLETSLTDRGARLPQARHAVRAKPSVAGAFQRANFQVLSCAGNHCMDWGADALFDTIAYLHEAGIKVVGAGADIQLARRPVIQEVDGTRVAFLAYSSILPLGYWAEEKRAGCAPMRAWTTYEPIEHDQPGTPARIHTFAYQDDLQRLLVDVADARLTADVVIVSLHWGIHFIPAVLADYQREVGHAAIDAGADLILGHHAHILKGAEIYQGKPIFFSIGNFAVDLRIDKAHAESMGFKEIQKLHPHWVPDFDSLYNFPEDSRKTVAIKVAVRGGRINSLSVMPAYINSNAQPAFLAPEDPQFNAVRDYLNEISVAAQLNGRFETHEGELLLGASGGG